MRYLIILCITNFFTLNCKLKFVEKKRELENSNYNDGAGGKGPRVAIIGDSLSSGIMASSQLGEGMSDYLRDKISRGIISVSDSIQDESLSQPLMSEYQFSATATDQDWGPRAFIAKQMGFTDASDIPTYGAFRWGARVADVPSFIEILKKTYETKPKADFIFLFLGGNDFCHDDTPQLYKENYEKALDMIMELHPKGIIILVYVPHVPSWIKYDDVVYSPIFSCKKFQNNFCKPVHRTDMESRYESYLTVIDGMEKYKQDSFGGKIFLAKETRHKPIAREEIGFDCFHMSILGQKNVAKGIEGILPDAVDYYNKTILKK